MKVAHRIVLAAFFVAYVNCQGLNDIDVDDVKKKLEEAVPNIEELDSDILNKTKLPNAEEVKNVLREKCKKNGAEEVVDNLEEVQNRVKTCMESHVNLTVVQEELEEAKKTGSMDEVFAKYCKKWPSMYACFDNVTSIARSCMDDKEVKAFNKSLDIVTELQEFACFKDGDRLAMFVAEGGVECISERKEGVQNCLNATLGARLPDPDDFSAATLPTFLFSDKDCQDFNKVRECINKELEKCKDTTPANIVDAFFKFLKKHMPCESQSARTGASQPNSSWLTASSTLLVIASLWLSRIY